MITHLQIYISKYWRIFNGEIAVNVIINKIVIHGNYVNNESAVEQKHIEMHMLHKNIFIQNKR